MRIPATDGAPRRTRAGHRVIGQLDGRGRPCAVSIFFYGPAQPTPPTAEQPKWTTGWPSCFSRCDLIATRTAGVRRLLVLLCAVSGLPCQRRRPLTPSSRRGSPRGRQRHPGDFRCGRWWFVGEDGRLRAHRRRMGTRARRHPRPRRRQRHGRRNPRRQHGDADGHLHAWTSRSAPHRIPAAACSTSRSAPTTGGTAT